jgi:glycosyltransferase involved in cell wall biosynthesis
MKILHVIASLDRGGAENHLTTTARYQALDGHDVTVLFMKGVGYWTNFLTSFGVKTIGLNLRFHFSLTGIVRFILLVKKLKPKIIHAHLPPAEFLTFVGARFCNARYLVTKHTDAGMLFASRTNKLYFFNFYITRYFLRQPLGIICISNAVYRYFDRLNVSVFRERACVQHYGYDRQLYNNTLRPSIEDGIKTFCQDAQLVVVNIARHVRQKRIQMIIEALAIAKKSNLNIKLIQIGVGPDTANLQLQAKNHRVENNIFWAGATDNVDEFLNHSDVFTLSSTYEGFGLVILEAMYNKLPIVASNFGDVREMLTDIQRKHIHQQIDAVKIFESWLSLLDQSERESLGIANYLKVTTQFDPLLVHQRTFGFYEVILSAEA